MARCVEDKTSCVPIPGELNQLRLMNLPMILWFGRDHGDYELPKLLIRNSDNSHLREAFIMIQCIFYRNGSLAIGQYNGKLTDQ